MPRVAPSFIPFESWPDVVDAAYRALRGAQLWYWAPLDLAPRLIQVVRVYKNGGIRINPVSTQADNFTADKMHLDRFYRREGK